METIKVIVREAARYEDCSIGSENTVAETTLELDTALRLILLMFNQRLKEANKGQTVVWIEGVGNELATICYFCLLSDETMHYERLADNASGLAWYQYEFRPVTTQPDDFAYLLDMVVAYALAYPKLCNSLLQIAVMKGRTTASE